MRYDVLADKVIYFRDVFEDPNGWLNGIELANTPFITDWSLWEKSTYEADKPYMKQYGHKKIIYGSAIFDYQLEDYPNDGYSHVKILSDAISNCLDIYKSIYGITLEHESNKDMFVLSKYDNTDAADLQDHLDIDGDWEEYSIVIYINDEYKGGELELPNLGIKIKPEKASIIVFPSGRPYNHIAHKAYDGQKYFISHFWKTGAGAGYIPLASIPNNVRPR